MRICWKDTRERSVAILATLHLGIEPTLLGLLAQTGAMPPVAAGWVVGAAQIGMSAGALLSWRTPAAAGRPVGLAAALLGTGAGVGLAAASDLGSLLVLRLLLGASMGLLLARSTAAAAHARPQRALGLILLGQQLLAAIVMMGLPMIAARSGAVSALVALAAAPFIAGLLMRFEADRPAPPPRRLPQAGDDLAIQLRGARLAAMALLVGVTMMVWSYIGAVGTRMGVDSHVAGMAIALTSLASVPAALMASFSTRRPLLAITPLGCGLGILSPLLLPENGGLIGYAVAMIMFNMASAYAAICLSAAAMEGFADERGRRLVVLVQCGAMAGGGPLGAVAVGSGGLPALTALVAFGVAAAAVAPLVARYRFAAGEAVTVPFAG